MKAQTRSKAKRAKTAPDRFSTLHPYLLDELVACTFNTLEEKHGQIEPLRAIALARFLLGLAEERMRSPGANR